MNRTGDTIAVIACAGSKKRNAGRLVDDGRKVMFVAHPEDAPADGRFLYRRPDDPASSGRSFRDMLEEYNRDRRADNPWGLLPAWELYVPPAYRALRDACGADNFFVLSAGWGLVGADYLLPAYDITFSYGAKGRNAYKRRRASATEAIAISRCCRRTLQNTSVFFGGKDYVPLFCSLTEGVAQTDGVPLFAERGRPLRGAISCATPPPRRGCGIMSAPWRFRRPRLLRI